MFKRSLMIGLVLVIALAIPLTAFAQDVRGEGSVHAEGDGRVYVRATAGCGFPGRATW